ncbi:hypothetical protein [Thiomicrorhabdus sp.]|uniref:hypothetical protein n=1 Tax=Thiomicrorhabdus sp. TaxID=2039724 RepID=UPI00356AFF70
MASVDETFDPNDLDSIDALLDEAEQEVAENLEEDTLLDEEAVKVDEQAAVPDIQEIEPQVDNVASPEVESAQTVNADAREMADSRQKPELDGEDFLSKRAAAQNQSNNGLSAAEMDAIKKLVIIFGSTIIVLALTMIGIGVWAALAASHGLDEETQTMIEEIKTGTEKNTMNHLSNAKSMDSMEKKLDALSYQLEQITADIAVLEGRTKIADNTPASGASSTNTNTPTAENVTPVAAPVAAPTPAVSGQLTDKLNSVYYKMTKAQKRIDEVNSRVKKLQGQYSTLLHSVKVVEKQMLDQQVKAAPKEKEAAKTVDEPVYQYSAPEGAYEQAHPDTYP